MSYYHGLISGRQANAILSKSVSDGCFLIRDSQSQPGQFVLSVRYRDNIYHVLIFHEDGDYFLDSNLDDVERFGSLEDLVLYGMAHELRVAGEEVVLQEPILCNNDSETIDLLSSMNGHKARQSVDCDSLTDLFASAFGSHCSVLVAVHSNLRFDGQTMPPGEANLACIVKDSQQKAFYIRIIDCQNQDIIGEKKVTKSFEYDMPSELVLTFLSEHGITCLGFRDHEERELFLRHIDRIVQLQQKRAVKLKVRQHSSSSPPAERKSPTELNEPVRAENFDIYKVSPEWQYLFDQAGVTLAMLEDKPTLQFILDQVYSMGGAPKKLHSRKEMTSSQEERAVAIATDSVLRQESLRASKLADELRKRSSKDAPQPMPRKFHTPTCSTTCVSTRYKELVLRRNSLGALAPVQVHCYCSACAAGKPLVAVSGSPPHQYSLPLDWCQFVLRSQTNALAQSFCSSWHVAFSLVSASHIGTVIRTGRLPHSLHDGKVVLSPDANFAKRMTEVQSETYYDEVERQDYRVNIAFQPGSYTVQNNDTMFTKPLNQVWLAPDRTYIPYAMLFHLQPL